jgi:hypothetical protein
MKAPSAPGTRAPSTLGERIRRALRALAGALWGPLPGALAALAPAPVAGLHECPDCRSDMVCPIDWHTLDAERWAMDLHCGQCGLRRDVVATNAQAADFDGALDERQRMVEHALARLDAERMAAEVDAFVEALERDLIDAGDFRR